MNLSVHRHDVRQEEDIIPWRKLVAIALGVLGIILLLVLWSAAILRGRLAVLRPSGQFPERDLGPRREVAGVQQRLFVERATGEEGPGQILNRRKRQELSSFDWVDRARGVVRIPVDDAMELVVEEGRR